LKFGHFKEWPFFGFWQQFRQHFANFEHLYIGMINFTAVEGYSMRNKALVFVAVLLGACSSQTASLDNARNQLVQTRTDYQDCVNGGSGEVTNQCEAKRVAADNAERAYREAMSSGLR